MCIRLPRGFYKFITPPLIYFWLNSMRVSWQFCLPPRLNKLHCSLSIGDIPLYILVHRRHGVLIGLLGFISLLVYFFHCLLGTLPTIHPWSFPPCSKTDRNAADYAQSTLRIYLCAISLDSLQIFTPQIRDKIISFTMRVLNFIFTRIQWRWKLLMPTRNKPHRGSRAASTADSNKL
jgi:hypothetical protein